MSYALTTPARPGVIEDLPEDTSLYRAFWRAQRLSDQVQSTVSIIDHDECDEVVLSVGKM